MNVERRLALWRSEGLIDDDTAGRIASYERARRAPAVFSILAAIGAGTAALGLVSIVAANWGAIPGRVKLGCDLAIGAALAIATARAALRGDFLATETLVTLFWGFALASIGLVGQVYQLATPLHRALLGWAATTTPLMLLARSRPVVGLAAFGWLAAQASGYEALFSWLYARVPAEVARNLVVVLLASAPLPWLILGRSPWVSREHPEHAKAAEAIGWRGLVAAGFVACFAWYQSRGAAPSLTWGLAGVGLVVAALVGLLRRRYPQWPSGQRNGVALALAIAWVALALAQAWQRPATPWVGALAQVAFLAALAWASVAGGQIPLFRSLTAALGLRILVVYFEVFGSLMSTGLGLLAGGLLTLLLVWLWRRQVGSVAGEGGDGVVA